MSSFVVAAAILMCFFSASSAYDFTINWAQNPKESFTAWASRMRFQVNDKLVFKYNTAEDSVLMVKKEDYDACNVKNPVQKLEGPSFQLTRSGPFYFISGVEEKCSKGEKLVLVVLAERNKKPVIPKPPTSPSPTTPPSSSSPLKPPTQSPTPPSMAPTVSPPTSSMAPSVSTSPPASSMAPSVSTSPASSMAPSVSSSPAASSMAPSVSSSPSSSMAPGTNSESPAPSSAENAKSSTTALTASSLTIMMGAIMILGQALLG